MARSGLLHCPTLSNLAYTPSVLTDWDSNADPGGIDDALDQLAARTDDIEGSYLSADGTLIGGKSQKQIFTYGIGIDTVGQVTPYNTAFIQGMLFRSASKETAVSQIEFLAHYDGLMAAAELYLRWGISANDAAETIMTMGRTVAGGTYIEFSGHVLEDIGNASADTHALNRITADGRYAAIAGGGASYLLSTGATTGATSQAQTFTNGITVNESGAASNTRIEGDTDPNLFFVDAGADKIGIGSNAPQAKLHIEGDEPDIILNDTGAAGYTTLGFQVAGEYRWVFGKRADSNFYIARYYGGSWYNEALFIDYATGYIGIGTSTPQNALHIMADEPDIILDDTGSAGYSTVTFYEAGAAKWAFGKNNVADFYFTRNDGSNWYNGTFYMERLTGKIGFGTTTPATPLHTLLTDAGTNAVVNVSTIGHDTSGTAANGFGAGIAFQLQSSTTAGQDAAQLAVAWTNATHATRTSKATLNLVASAAALAEVMSFAPAEVVVNDTGNATTDLRAETDTEANMLLVDASADLVYIGGTTNGVKIEKAGNLTLLGTAMQWEDLRVEPVARTTGTNAPTFEKWYDDAAGTSRGVYLYSFDDAAAGSEKEIFFTMQLPHAWAGTAISMHVHWVGSHDDTTADPRWGLEYTWREVGQLFNNTTTIYSEGTHITFEGNDPDVTAGYHYITEFNDLSTVTGISSVLIGRLFRNSSDAGDTYNVSGNKCGLLYIDAHYEVNSFGSNTEYTK